MVRPESLPQAVERLKRGGTAVLIVDNTREPYGVIMQAARDVTASSVNLWATEFRGVICVAIGEKTANRLSLPPMPGRTSGADSPEFLVSVEARRGVSTGISAPDRMATLHILADESATETDIVSPGHIFPVLVRNSGVLGRASEAEGAHDLVRIATGADAAAYCHILNVEGLLAGSSELVSISTSHDIPIVYLSDLVHYRMENELFVHVVSEGVVPTDHGPFRVLLYKNELDGLVHPVLIKGEMDDNTPVLARIHSQCLTGDVFHSWRCDCGDQLSGALTAIREHGSGVIIYLRQEGRGIGLPNKVRAYALQDRGKDTVDANLELGFDADHRSFVAAAQIFRDLGIKKLRLMTNNAQKIAEMFDFGLDVVERIALPTPPRNENLGYLRTKKDRLGHLLDLKHD
ncbi:MAG: GTP cyclohydrolase II [Myxococcales bacterium]|nr:GTP cyclohydrolase II [Myxococcales bacterium]